jgi:hypothetical protein
MSRRPFFPKHVCIRGCECFIESDAPGTDSTNRSRAVNTEDSANPTWETPNPITARLNLYKDDVYPFGGRH